MKVVQSESVSLTILSISEDKSIGFLLIMEAAVSVEVGSAAFLL